MPNKKKEKMGGILSDYLYSSGHSICRLSQGRGRNGGIRDHYLQVEKGITTIILNRPETLNAITRNMFPEIGQALDDADNKVSIVVIKGSGKAFCTEVSLKFAMERPKTLHHEQDLFRLGNKNSS